MRKLALGFFLVNLTSKTWEDEKMMFFSRYLPFQIGVKCADSLFNWWINIQYHIEIDDRTTSRWPQFRTIVTDWKTSDDSFLSRFLVNISSRKWGESPRDSPRCWKHEHAPFGDKSFVSDVSFSRTRVVLKRMLIVSLCFYDYESEHYVGLVVLLYL